MDSLTPVFGAIVVTQSSADAAFSPSGWNCPLILLSSSLSRNNTCSATSVTFLQTAVSTKCIKQSNTHRRHIEVHRCHRNWTVSPHPACVRFSLEFCSIHAICVLPVPLSVSLTLTPLCLRCSFLLYFLRISVSLSMQFQWRVKYLNGTLLTP